MVGKSKAVPRTKGNARVSIYNYFLCYSCLTCTKNYRKNEYIFKYVAAIQKIINSNKIYSSQLILRDQWNYWEIMYQHLLVSLQWRMELFLLYRDLEIWMN